MQTGTVLTRQGKALQAKAQTGVKLEFTRVGLGDSLLPNGAILGDMTALISPQKTLPIKDIAVIGDGTSRIRVLISNTDLSVGFFIREIGVFALDPDDGEILYSIVNVGNEADFIPAKGGPVAVEQILDLITIVGNAENVVAIIDEGAYITRREFDALRSLLCPPPIDGGQFTQVQDVTLDGGVFTAGHDTYLDAGTYPEPYTGKHFADYLFLGGA